MGALRRVLNPFTPLPLRGLAVALLASVSTLACSTATEAEAEVRQKVHSAEPSPCAGVSLDARRGDEHREDGRVAFAHGTLTFSVPDRIPVTQGAAGDGEVEFTYRSRDGRTTSCRYRGQGPGGQAYVLRACAPRRDRAEAEAEGREDALEPDEAAAPVAGTRATAAAFRLRVLGGDGRMGPTAVHLGLPGPELDDQDACTADRCDPATGTVSHLALADDDGDDCTTDRCDPATGPVHAPVDTAVCRGRAGFHDRAPAGLAGNGRACSDCHLDSEHFQLTPAAARARFEAMQRTGQDDPLFRPQDADDFREHGAAAHDYTNLLENALVRVTLPLPANVKLLDCGAAIPCPESAMPTDETVADVWRAVPSILDVAITGPDGAGPSWPRGPNQRGGYQLDARIDTLQHQALSALQGHAAIAAEPRPGWLDDVAAFERTQFSSGRVQALAEAMAAGTTPLPDADRALDALELQGRAVFDRSCGQCHGDLAGHPSGSTPILQGTPGTATALKRYHSVATTCPRPVDTVSPPRFAFAACSESQLRNVRTYQITNSGVAPGGSPCGGGAPQPPCVTRLTTSDPGRMLLTGFPDPGGPGDLEHLDVPGLRGLRHTAPYFSNNTAATLEAVLDHYQQFFKRVAIQAPTAPLLTTQPGVVPPVHDRPFTDAEVPALLAYLRTL